MINYKEGFPPPFLEEGKVSVTFYLNTNTKQSHVDKVDTPFICHLQKKYIYIYMKALNLTNQKLEQTFYHYLNKTVLNKMKPKAPVKDAYMSVISSQ